MQQIEHLLSEYRAAAKIHAEPNDGSASWISRVNKAADRMVLISHQVASAGADAVAAFGQLVKTDDPHLSIWAAHHMLDFMQPDERTREDALAVIFKAAEAKSADGIGERLWLDNWRAEQQDE